MDTGIWLKNRVLKQAKMVSIYQKNNTKDTPKSFANYAMQILYHLIKSFFGNEETE